MICVPVWWPWLYPRKHPVMLLSSRYSIPGFWTRDSPYLPHVDSVASSFRKLVTFAIVLEVRGISFFQILWTTLRQMFVGSKDHNRSGLDEFSILYCDSASSTFLHGLSGRNMLNLFDILIHASTTQITICSFGLSLFSCIPTFIYQLIVKSMCAIVLIDAYYSCGPSSHSIPVWLGETNSRTSSISRIESKQL